MCTAICYRSDAGSFFGRNLDLEYRLYEMVTLTPRNFTFNYKYAGKTERHYAILGTAVMIKETPMYYDGMNEHGLCMAALNFPKSGVLREPAKNKINIATYEIIPYILGSCKNINEAKSILKDVNLTNDSPDMNIPAAALHFMLSDKERSIVFEALAESSKIYENQPEVLTNEPPFDFHINNLSLYINLSNIEEHQNHSVLRDVSTGAYCRGLFERGLPGDLSSPSRFIRAAFAKCSSPNKENTIDAVNQTFHILSRTAFCEGEIKIDDKYDITQYTSVADMNELCYYFNSYNCLGISSVKMKEKDLNGSDILQYKLYADPNIKCLNQVF